jgi:hypothetical protein
MDLLKETISGAAGAIVGTAILTLIALPWRRWLIRRYNLTEAARRVLEALWDENLLRGYTGRSLLITRLFEAASDA